MHIKQLKSFFLFFSFLLIIFIQISCAKSGGNPLSPKLTQAMKAATKKSIQFLPYLNISVAFQKGISTETKSLIGKILDSIRIIFHLPDFEDSLQKFMIHQENYSIVLDEPSYSIAKKYTSENSYLGKLLYFMKWEKFQMVFFFQNDPKGSDFFKFESVEFHPTEGTKSKIFLNPSLENSILQISMNILLSQLTLCIIQSFAKIAQPIPDDPDLLMGVSELFKLFYKRNRTHPELSRILHGYQFYIKKTTEQNSKK